ncbi:GHKL domain-containing protein [Aerococcaceae bacterium INB8]|uniref:GHKL domain-containing protein n=1 Tax=Ruoffia halotolerans TaxID=2748684 RepID=A0A839A8C1_9LACT|nr:sensor histidine kinase [Ruoffia halotolerans]MBA5730212.1 GHKL domain-containing protein [Ruoffia halotolerans]
MIFFDIFYLLMTPIYIFNIWSYFRMRFESTNKSYFLSTIICVISYFLISFTYLFLEIPFLTLLVNIICGYLISSLFCQNIVRQLTESLILILSFIAIEILVITSLNFFTINYLDASSFQSISAVTLNYLTEYLFIKHLSRRKYQTIYHIKHTFLERVQLIVPLITVLFFLLIANKPLLTEIEFIAVAVFFILINIILFELYDALARSFNLLAEQQNYEQVHSDYANQLQLFESHTEEWREFRHDLANRLTPLYGFIDRYPNSELEDIITNIIPLNLKEKSINTKNMVIDSVINSKLQAASNKNISLSTEIQVPKHTYFDSVDLAVLLGNLLDNAIEGCLTVQENRFINIKILFEANKLKIEIANSFDGIVNKQGDQLLSRKKTSELHGFGLASVRRIVNKYNGLQNINYNNEIFIMKVILFELRAEEMKSKGGFDD